MGCGGVVKEAEVVKPEVKTEVKTPKRGDDPVYVHSMNSTVALVRRNEETNKVNPFCTGVWVSKDEILTAAHCVSHDDFSIFSPVGDDVHYIIQKEVRPGKEPAAMHLAQVSYFNNRHDLAILKAVAEGLPAHEVAILAIELPGIGESVHMVGHPRGLYWAFTGGIVSAYRVDKNIGPVMQVNGTVWFGNSGGGVFDRDGNLIGICSRLSGVPNVNTFVHLDSVKAAIKATGANKK